ncbi:glycosyltransferase family 2 protein [Streptomyces sp. NPDC096013]|uniref:glycosyltransferase family 2 protein n=1 Tax=Streptomyces sp. NPDC096013 TaxID=3366069 RepID=UPI00381DBC43
MAGSASPTSRGSAEPDGGPVTVAVCSVGRPVLDRALTMLAAGDTGPIAEVLVVDNTPDTSLDVERLADILAPLPLRVLRGPGGTSEGRNLILDQAVTDVVLCFDDDCLPAPSWAAELAAYMRSEPDVAAAFGLVEPVPAPGARVCTDKVPLLGSSAWGEADGPDGEKLWCPAVTSPHWEAGVVTSEPTVPWAVVGSSNNMALRRSLMLPGRPAFLPGLGPGTGAGSGEDTEFGYALMAAGRTLAYIPEAKLLHDSWLPPKAAEWTHRCYLRGTVEALGQHVMRGDERARTLLIAYLMYFSSDNAYGLRDLGEILEWGYGDHVAGRPRQPRRKSDLDLTAMA